MKKGEPAAKKAKAAKKLNNKKACDAKNKDCKYDRSPLDLRIILTTMVCVLVGILIVLILFYAGLCAGRKGGVSGYGGDIAVLPVSYDSALSSYKIEVGDNENILSDLDVAKKGQGYAVIESYDQLNQLYEIIGDKNKDEIENFTAPEFFQTGSMVAVVTTDDNVINPVVDSISRDGNYDLSIAVRGVKKIGKTEEDKHYAYVSVVRVVNINPDYINIIEDYR